MRRLCVFAAGVVVAFAGGLGTAAKPLAAHHLGDVTSVDIL